MVQLCKAAMRQNALVFLFFALNSLARWALGQCTIEGAIDIIWLIDASRGSEGEPGQTQPLAQLSQAIQEMTARTIMSPTAVRQSFVVFSGVVDPSVTTDWAKYVRIGSSLSLSESAATSQDLFIQAVQANVSIIGGSRDTAGAITHARRNILTGDRMGPSRKFLILALSGPATDSLGNLIDESSTARALDALYEEDEGIQTLLLQLGPSGQFPAEYLRNHVDFTFTTTYDLVVNDLIDSGVFCFFFDTASPVEAPLPTLQPTVVASRKCYDLVRGGSQTVGTVCATPAPGTVTLEYETGPDWRIEGSNIWYGGDPTTVTPISAGIGGSPILGVFPTTSLSIVVELSRLRFNDECQLYVIPSARVIPAGNDSQTAEDGPVYAFSGDVRFHPDSEAMIFRLPVSNCQGQATVAPTVPTPAPTPRRFNLDVFYASPFPDEYKPAVNRALGRVRNLFVDDFASQVCFEQGSTWCGFTFGTRMCVDDVLIVLMDKALDGKEGRLAASGPCVISADTEQVRIGQVQIDTEDLATVSQDGRLENLLAHQIMHILGFGSRWETWGVVSNSASGFIYVGKRGVEGFLQIGGNSATSIELDAYGMHWKEEMFGSELMTSSLGIQESSPISALTIRSLMDIGLPVNPNRAETFRLPGSTRRMLEQERRRDLQMVGSSDVLSLPLQYANYTVKPGRDEDLQREIAFAQENIRLTRGSGSGSGIAPATIGIIVGVICALLFLFAISAFIVMGRRGKKKKAPKPKAIAEPKKPEGPALHTNWYERTDTDGRIYWVNEETGEFSWAPPEAFNRAPDREPSNATSQTVSTRRAMPRGPGGDKWSEMTDETGNAYWVNEESGEFSWVAPAGYSSAKSMTVPQPLSPIRRVPSSSNSPALVTSMASDHSQMIPKQPESPHSIELDEETHPAFSRRDSPMRPATEPQSYLSEEVIYEEEQQTVEIDEYAQNEDGYAENADTYAENADNHVDNAEHYAEDANNYVETADHYDDVEASAFDRSNMSLSAYAPDDSHLYESMPTYSARSRLADDALL